MIETNFKIYNRKSNLRVRKFNEEYYMLCSGKCYEINEIGAIIVKYLGQDIEVKELSNKINEVYSDTNPEIIEKDIEVFISFLYDEGLIYINE